MCRILFKIPSITNVTKPKFFYDILLFANQNYCFHLTECFGFSFFFYVYLSFQVFPNVFLKQIFHIVNISISFVVFLQYLSALHNIDNVQIQWSDIINYISHFLFILLQKVIVLQI